jgi:hypothetical protein
MPDEYTYFATKDDVLENVTQILKTIDSLDASLAAMTLTGDGVSYSSLHSCRLFLEARAYHLLSLLETGYYDQP